MHPGALPVILEYSSPDCEETWTSGSCESGSSRETGVHYLGPERCTILHLPLTKISQPIFAFEGEDRGMIQQSTSCPSGRGF